jgi:hypothetical protein
MGYVPNFYMFYIHHYVSIFSFTVHERFYTTLPLSTLTHQPAESTMVIIAVA